MQVNQQSTSVTTETQLVNPQSTPLTTETKCATVNLCDHWNKIKYAEYMLVNQQSTLVATEIKYAE